MKWTKENPPVVIKKTFSNSSLDDALAAANQVFDATGSEEQGSFAYLLSAGDARTARIRAGATANGFQHMVSAMDAMKALELPFHYDGIVISNTARKFKKNSFDTEIFAVGVWNGMRFDAVDLQDIVDNFKTLRDVHKVPLKIGHNSKQPLTDGQPAIGWVSDVWVNGNKLMARFDDVPDIVKSAMEKRLYRRVSIELDFDVQYKNKLFRNVLSGVALLGADLPAVNVLADLDTYIGGESRLAASRHGLFSSVSGTLKAATNQREENEMTEEQIQAMVDKATAPIIAQNKEYLSRAEKAETELKELRNRQAEADKAAKAEKVKFARDAVNNVLDAAVKAKKILPAQRDKFSKLLGVDDDERVIGIKPEDIEILVPNHRIDLSAKGKGPGDEEDEEDEDTEMTAGEQLTKKTNEYMTKSGEKSFSIALNQVMKSEPELAREYMLENGFTAEARQKRT